MWGLYYMSMPNGLPQAQSQGGGTIKVVHEAAPRKESTKFCYKIKSCPTPCLGSVLHVHAQWVTPSPVPGGAIGQSLEGSVLQNITMLVTKLALEISEQTFVIK